MITLVPEDPQIFLGIFQVEFDFQSNGFICDIVQDFLHILYYVVATNFMELVYKTLLTPDVISQILQN